jgi:hypothetical protein
MLLNLRFFKNLQHKIIKAHLMMVISDIIIFSSLPSTRIFFNTDFYHDTKSLSSSAQYVTSQKYFSHPSSSYLLGKTRPIKLKLGLQIGCRL